MSKTLFKPVHRSVLSALLATLFVAAGCGRSDVPAPQGSIADPPGGQISRTAPASQGQPHSTAAGNNPRRAAVEPEAPRVQRIRADDVVEHLVETLGDGRQVMAETLRRVGLAEVVDDIVRVDGFQAYDLSSEALVREVYRRAEAETGGQGERVLAYLYKEAELEFGTVKDDPAFSRIRARAAELTELSPQSLDPANFRFASAQAAARVEVSPALNRAIQQLSYVYAQPHLSQLRGLAAKHFRAPRFNYDRALAESNSSRDAIARMFQTGTPPPRAEVAAEAILRETLAQNGALRQHRAFLESIDELRTELGL